MKRCEFCDKSIDGPINLCNWECHVGLAKRNGGVAHTPNGLPISSIHADNSMWEHEHGDHPDYKFPVDVEYVGDLKGTSDPAYDLALYGRVLNDAEARDAMTQTHALIYTDGSIALTLYECCYCLFSLNDGHNTDSRTLWKRGEWKLADESLKKAREARK